MEFRSAIVSSMIRPLCSVAPPPLCSAAAAAAVVVAAPTFLISIIVSSGADGLWPLEENMDLRLEAAGDNGRGGGGGGNGSSKDTWW